MIKFEGNLSLCIFSNLLLKYQTINLIKGGCRSKSKGQLIFYKKMVDFLIKMYLILFNLITRKIRRSDDGYSSLY